MSTMWGQQLEEAMRLSFAELSAKFEQEKSETAKSIQSAVFAWKSRMEEHAKKDEYLDYKVGGPETFINFVEPQSKREIKMAIPENFINAHVDFYKDKENKEAIRKVYEEQAVLASDEEKLKKSESRRSTFNLITTLVWGVGTIIGAPFGGIIGAIAGLVIGVVVGHLVAEKVMGGDPYKECAELKDKISARQNAIKQAFGKINSDYSAKIKAASALGATKVEPTLGHTEAAQPAASPTILTQRKLSESRTVNVEDVEVDLGLKAGARKTPPPIPERPDKKPRRG